MKHLVAACLFVTLCACAAAETVFSGLDLNEAGELLFTASYTNPFEKTNSALFVTEIETGTPRIITCAPEKMEVLNGGETLQLRNWYGTALYSSMTGTLRWIRQSDFFTNSIPSSIGVVDAVSVSPDGAWVVSYRKTSPAYADLVLSDVQSGTEQVISTHVPYVPQEVPVCWSPDSGFLLYEHSESLYFANPKHFFSGTLLDESYRKLGEGSIRNVYWASSSKLIYIHNTLVYSVLAADLQIRSLYSGIVTPGSVIFRLPFPFDSYNDRFWASSEGTSLMYVKNNSALFRFALDGIDYTDVSLLRPSVSVQFPANIFSVRVFWQNAQNAVVWTESLYGGEIRQNAFMVSPSASVPLALPVGAREPQLSPDGAFLSFFTTKGLFVYDPVTWKQTGFFPANSITSFRWADSRSLYIADTTTLRRWNITRPVAQVLFLTSAESYGWSLQANTVLAFTSQGNYAYSRETNTWNASSEPQIRLPQIQNGNWRVFIDEDPGAVFPHSIFARANTGVSSTIAVFSRSTAKTKPQKKQTIALVFDALDNAAGLAGILHTLNTYALKTTFFINGEFIQLYPAATREIVSGAHQCGSMFNANIDVNTDKYVIDADFVLRSLARNEDDFFTLTGRELSSFWHTPNYIVNPLVKQTAAKAGYAYVDQSISVDDRISADMNILFPGLYKPVPDLIEYIVSKLHNGAVIPVSVGATGRDDCLYNSLDVLIEAIAEAGYKIVPVSDLKTQK